METTENLIENLKQVLPDIIRQDASFRRYILDLTQNAYSDRAQTEDRFDRILNELQRSREEQERKWAEQSKLWAENQRKWDESKKEDAARWAESQRKWDESKKEDAARWAENQRKWDESKKEQAARWEDNDRKWEENNRKWEASQLEFQRVHEEIMAQAKKFDRSIGALGARWGLQSEATFRQALAGILEENFGVQVINVNEYDQEGIVFGRPEQVELDLIIKNGTLLICELKSSIDKAGMYIFERKVRYYEKQHQRKADRLIVISPMIDRRAVKVAESLGIDLYCDSSEVESL